MQTLKEGPAGWVEPELSLLYVCNNYKSGKKSKQTQQPQNEKLTNLKQDFFFTYITFQEQSTFIQLSSFFGARGKHNR